MWFFWIFSPNLIIFKGDYRKNSSSYLQFLKSYFNLVATGKMQNLHLPIIGNCIIIVIMTVGHTKIYDIKILNGLKASYYHIHLILSGRELRRAMLSGCGSFSVVEHTLIILPSLLCSSICSVYIVPECTLARIKQLHWGLLCAPQCGWADTLSVTGHRSRTALLPYSQASAWPQKHEGGGNGTWKKKTRTMIDGFLWSYFLPPLEWMTANYLWLSVQLRDNCSFCAYLTGTYASNVRLGWIYNPPPSENQMFFCRQEGRCNYFAMFA